MTAPVTLEEVEAFGAKWVPRLHLRDWHIEYKVERIDGDAMADCNSEFKRKLATIRIDPRQLSKWNRVSGNRTLGLREHRLTEANTVHELVHLLEQPLGHKLMGELWPEGETEPRAHEQFLEYREMMIETHVLILLEADAAGAWGNPLP